MTAWSEVVWAALDTETTGVDVETDRIVTACVGIGDPKLGTWHPREWLINPGVPIPDEAAAIHGVTTEKARAEGVDPVVALAEIRDAIADGRMGLDEVAAYEAREVPTLTGADAYEAPAPLVERDMARVMGGAS